MSDDESLRRLRAADPSQGQPTDLESLRRAVRTRLAERPPQEPSARGRDELAERRARRRSAAWLAGAAAALVVGVGGYALGIGSAGGGDSAGGAAEDAGSENEVFTASGGDDAGPVPTVMEQEEAADGADFVVAGISEEGGTAESFSYEPVGVATAERTEQVAQALGVTGAAEPEGAGWVVADAEGRRVEIVDDAVGSLIFEDPGLDPGACAVSGSDVSSPDSLGACEEGGALTDPIATVQALLEKIGIDADTLDLVVGGTSTGVAQVVGYPAGSAPVGAPAWTVTLGAEGVGSLTGRLAPLVSLGDSDVIAPTVAVDRLADARFGALAVGQQSPGADPSTWLPAAGDPHPWPPGSHTITHATLTLISYPLEGGTSGVLPAWALSTDDGANWVVVAATEADLGL